jgi:membrane protease YdiL (CAAX protease family)
MSSELTATLPKLFFPVVAIGVVLFASHKRGLSWKDHLGLRAPRPWQALAWLALFAALTAAEEVAYRLLGIPSSTPWHAFSLPVLLLRIAAIGIAGPIAEEFVFRGLVLTWLRRTTLGTFGAVMATAAIWAGFHFQYDGWQLAQVFIDGIALGAARVNTRSLWVPILMHIGGNLFAVYQAVHP